MVSNTSILMGTSALILTGISVVCSVSAQKIKIRDSMDHFIADLHKQGQWSMWATILQAIAIAILVVRLVLTGDV
jgi:hypothetical protein